jgi:hypothetical protein
MGDGAQSVAGMGAHPADRDPAVGDALLAALDVDQIAANS